MKKSYFILLLAMMTACSTFSRQDAYMGLYKGMPQRDALSSMKKNSSAEYSVDVKSGKARVFVYDAFVGIYQEMVPGQDKSRSVSQWDNYYIVFRNEILLYHGYLYEFLRHGNTDLNEIGIKIKEHEEK